MSIFKGMTVLVTGGASETSQALIRSVIKTGGSAVICDTKFDDRIKDDKALYVTTDVTSEVSVDTAIQEGVMKFGQINVAINNNKFFHASSVYNKTFDRTYPMDLFKKSIDTMVIGTFNVNRLVSRQMAKQEPNMNGERGVIINTTDIHDWYGHGCIAAGSGAINAMTLPMARDLAPLKIRVATICQGLFLKTNFERKPDHVKDMLFGQGCHPIRPGMPKEYVRLVKSIVQNSFINGTTINLSAGLKLNRL